MDEKYWEGISSLREERSLKKKAEQPYYEQLDQLAKSEMKWDFDDFVQMTAESTEKGYIVPSKSKSRWWVLASGMAASLALVLGFLFFKSNDSEEVVVSAAKHSSKIPSSATLPDAPLVQVDVPSDVATKNTRKQPKKRIAVQPQPQEMMDDLTQTGDDAYVFVNGKPVYDQEEAEEIVLASLQMMTANLQEGRNALEKVKYIQVEL
ncbi:hypothetical protein GCM10017764_00040 [Sphingobacterium griseoflavum]|uniref:FecR protein domain-containing protein n=2 Tax=Sphingobacterium griseoflavum TaxID=1474952 RepID=A0ABQ3HP77_9SPHI|nr:hypothetical protein GCM10017764_00040 [Sphingobacterium griseoflavum]